MTRLDRLAIDGGEPVRASMLPYGHQLIEDTDVAAVERVLRSDWLTTGPVVEAFEVAFARMCGARHAVAVSSGTAALHAAVAAAGVGPGDEVIVPALTFAATANCVVYQGASPVFADVRPDTLCIDVADVERRISPRTRAVIPVDYGGQPADLDELLRLGRARGLTIIEDAAHAPGATYRARTVGAISDLTCFSFHPVKQMTTAEGGMITTDDDGLAHRLRVFRNHGIDRDARARTESATWYYEIVEPGFNYRLSDVHSALGLAQLGRLPAWLGRRAALARRYSAELMGLPHTLPAVLDDRTSAWHLYPILLDLQSLRVGRTAFFTAMRAENIGVNVHYIPVPWHPYYQGLGHRRGSWPVAEAAYERMISLPLWAGMSDADLLDVVAAIRKVSVAYAQA